MYREPSVVEYPTYTLAFIEFDDQGEIWSPRQALDLQARIGEANRNEEGAVFIFFAHGWNNDASPANEVKGTLAGFRESLAILAADVARESPGRPVVGVYLAWRGQSLRGPLKALTFFTRQRAAARIAGAQAIALLGQLIIDTQSNPKSSLIVVGHSFGGQIIERMHQEGLASGLFFLQDNDLPAADDLTVLLNPASPATNAKQVIDLLKWHGIDLEKRAANGRRWTVPFLISITSETDLATRVAYRAGSFLGSLTRRFREYGPEYCSPIESQRTLYSRTAGHTSLLHSHEVRVRELTETTPDFAETAEGFTVKGEDVEIEVTRRENAYNDTPYWIMRVPREIMDGHSDTWNPNLLALLNGFYTYAGAFEKEAGIHMVRQPRVDPVFYWPRSATTAWMVDRGRQLFGLVGGRSERVRVGCLPEKIDLANVIGQAGNDASLIVVQRESGEPGDGGTQVVEIALGSGGFHAVGRTEIKSPVLCNKAAVDREAQTVYLATRREVLAASYGGRSSGARVVAELSLQGEPTAMAVDGAGERLLILDAGAGAVLEVSLRDHPAGTRTIVRGLVDPTALAIDTSNGVLYVMNRDGQPTLVRWCRTAETLGEREILTAYPDLTEPTFLAVIEDGSLWVGDPTVDRLYRCRGDGTIQQVFD
jgi:hypothetical protein